MKMNKLIYIIPALYVASIVNAGAQQRVLNNPDSSIRSLTVGDRVPDFLNQQNLLIIDFWATGCSGCVASMPLLDSLQKSFGKQLHIMPVTYEKKERVASFWKKNPYTRNTGLAYVTDDRTLSAYFPHLYIPHYVWIYKGVVAAITDKEYVNAENIQWILDGNAVDWPVKTDRGDYDYDKPLTTYGDTSERPAGSLYASVAPFQEGVQSKMGVTRDSVRNTQRAYLINLPVASAYFIAWSKVVSLFDLIRPSMFFTPNQVVLEVANPGDYLFERSGEQYFNAWQQKHAFCVETEVPDFGQDEKTMYRYLIADMDRLLGLHGRWERQWIPCLLLTELTEQERASRRSSKQPGDAGIDAVDLIAQMNKVVSNPPVFDNRSDKGRQQIAIPKGIDLSDISAVNDALFPVGLKFVVQEKEMDRLIITEMAGKK